MEIKKEVMYRLFCNSYKYSTDKGEISLLYPCAVTDWSYEIYCIRGNLFETEERFESLEEAEARIRSYLLNTFNK